MTYEEAIKNINALNAVCGQKDLYDAEFESALALAIDALEKQIPKKPAMGKYRMCLLRLGCRKLLWRFGTVSILPKLRCEDGR